jgi:hypothetical protein
VAGVADELGELVLQRVAVIPPIPEESQAASGPDDAVELRHRSLPIEPVERLRRERRVDACVRECDHLGRAFEYLGPWDGLPQLVEHGSPGLDRDYLVPDRNESASQLPRSGADVENSCTPLEPQLGGGPTQRLLGVFRPVPLVLSGHVLEAAGA